MEYFKEESGIRLKADFFDIDKTFSCGQCFRFLKQEDGSYCGVAGKHILKASQDGDQIFFSGMTEEEFLSFWVSYLDLQTDYGAMQEQFCRDETLKAACEYAVGIRLLRQDPFEAICSFILSSNNNIKRIQGMIDRLCQAMGEPLKEGYFAFPTPQRIAESTPEELAVLRAGYRTEYLLDAAQSVAEGRIDLEEIAKLTLDEAAKKLQTIKGVGPKVAACILLYGFHRLDAFPIDVWIRRALDKFYPNGLCKEAYPWIGLAQQYLFHYIRTCEKVGLTP